MAKALLAHSGGPTAVINATLLGLVERVREHQGIQQLYGARFGISGVLLEDFVDLGAQSASQLAAVARTPSSALGTSRHELEASDLETLLRVFRQHDIRYFFYNGGNGSMGTAQQIAAFAADNRYELNVVGVPKTIDNDVTHTDHTPGYLTTARFFACALRDVDADNRALPGQVEIVEVLGRNSGWIAGATALARVRADDGPHLIYFPEDDLPLETLLADVDQVFSRLDRCVISVCEGQHDGHGQPFGADVRRGSRGSLAMNLGHRLAMLLAQHLGVRSRSEKPGLLGRVTSAIVERDWEEARLCGQAAAALALAGDGPAMVTLLRDDGPDYHVRTGAVPLDQVGLSQRQVPTEWRTKNDIREGFRDYLQPMIGDIPAFARLEPFA